MKEALVALVGSCANLKVFSGEKTFEYDLALANPANTVLVTDALIHSEAIKGLCAMPDTLPDTLAKQFESEELESLDAIQDATQKDRHRFAATYLRCAENAKGGASHLPLRNSFAAHLTTSIAIQCPAYITDAIKWVTEERTRQPSGAATP